jgi:trans-aconitate 2-methyltransferase
MTWDAKTYDDRFGFVTRGGDSLIDLLDPQPGERILDLGCGTGELTATIADRGATVVGLDADAHMIERARERFPAIEFVQGEGHSFSLGQFDAVFSNAALHWVPDHRRLLPRLTRSMPADAQLAVQVPANTDHPSHTVAMQVAGESPFAEALAADPPPDSATRVLAPEEYSQILDELGFTPQHVRLQVYPHYLASSADVVEWSKGTALTFFRARLSDELYEQYLERYRRRLLDVIGDRQPYLYTFKRILMWGRRT